MGDNTQPQTEDQAQLGIKHVLRPFNNALTVYQGQPANYWMMLTEQPSGLDEFAGTPGYPANLLAGLRVPMGARIQIWLPHIYTAQVDPANVETYQFSLVYRLRNLVEYRNSPTRGPWHSPNSLGTPDTTPGTGGPRVLKPAAYRSYAVPQTPPADPPSQTREQVKVYPADLSPYAGNPAAGSPLAPDGTQGVIQSGVLDPNIVTPFTADSPFFDVINDVALGDELLIGVSRGTSKAANWDFTGPDANFRIVFSSSVNVGVYVFIGKVPSGQNSYT